MFPLVLLLATVSQGWPLIEIMAVAISFAALFSGFLIYRARQLKIPWIPAWAIAFVVLFPYSNLVFTLIYLRRLCSK